MAETQTAPTTDASQTAVATPPAPTGGPPPATPPEGAPQAPEAGVTTPEGATAPEGTTPPAEPDVDALAKARVTQTMVPVTALQKARDAKRAADAEVQRLGKELAEARRAPAAPPEPTTEPDALAAPETMTPAKIAELVAAGIQEHTAKREAQEAAAQAAADYEEARQDAIADLRKNVSEYRAEVLPSLTGQVASDADLFAWAVTQETLMAEAARQQLEDPRDSYFGMDEDGRAKLLADSGRRTKAFCAGLVAPQTTANEEARTTAPLSSSGVPAERLPEQITDIRSPKFFERVKQAITGAPPH